jgi:hypothetical protein
MSAIQRSVFPFGSTITDAYNISTNGTAVFGDNSNNLLSAFTPVNYLSQFAVKGNINCIGTNTDVSGASTGTYYSSSVSATSIPADSSANRPTQKLTGYIRYNTDLSQNNIEYFNGFNSQWQQLMTTTYYQSVVSVSPTQQNFKTAGTTTYTPTSSSILYIKIRMVGGGGGGAGSAVNGGAGGATSGGNGIATTFSSLFTANPGLGGAVNGNFTTANAVGGTITVGSGVIFAGGQGGGAAGFSNTGTQGGGQGGSSYFGGNGGSAGGSFTLSGGAGTSGGGGGGAGTFTSASFPNNLQTGAGGSAGGYIEVYLTSPASSYSIIVGAGGTAGAAGASGAAGGAGGAGVIIIDEYYH